MLTHPLTRTARSCEPRPVSQRGRRRPRRPLLAAGLSLLALVLAPAAAPAAGTLDQSMEHGSIAARVLAFGPVMRAQTFTAGLDGRLDQVDLLLRQAYRPSGAARVEIRAGSPAGPLLAAATIEEAEILAEPRWVPVPLAEAPRITAGEVYAIVFSVPGAWCPDFGDSPCDAYAWFADAGHDGDRYPAGAAWELMPSTTWRPTTARSPAPDHAFRSYVDQRLTAADLRERLGRYVRASEPYGSLPPAGQDAADALAARAGEPLEQMTPELTPAERDELVAAFARDLRPLVARGLLSAEQAAELTALAGDL